MGNTEIGLSFPDGDDPVDIAGDIKQLACEVDHLLSCEGKSRAVVTDFALAQDDEGVTVSWDVDYQDEDPPCPDPDYTGWFQWPPDLDGVDDTVVVSNVPLTWDMLPTYSVADNGSLRLLQQGPMGFVYAFDCPWDIYTNNPSVTDKSKTKKLRWLKQVLQLPGNQLASGYHAFNGASSLEYIYPEIDISNLTGIDGIEGMFYFANIGLVDFSTWDVSRVTSARWFLGNATGNPQGMENWCWGELVEPNAYQFASGTDLDRDWSNQGWPKAGAYVPGTGYANPFMSTGMQDKQDQWPNWGGACS